MVGEKGPRAKSWGENRAKKGTEVAMEGFDPSTSGL